MGLFFLINNATEKFDVYFFSLNADKIAVGKDNQMARKPNYGFEKRQKELARKAKKEEKNKRKQEEQPPESPASPESPEEN